MSARVAILGTGRMGSAMARRLAAGGVELTVWNRTGERARALGVGRVAATPAQAVADADVVLSSLTGPDAVRAAYEGADGALRSAHGQVFVEMSTAGPAAVETLAPQVTATGSGFVAGPVLGSPPMVERGAAALLVGGDVADVARARAVLEQLGAVREVGSAVDAARLKLVANSMLGAVVLAAAELQVAGEALGIRSDDVFWVLARLAPALEARRRGYLEGVHEPTLFAVRDLAKDLGLAVGEFDAAGSRTPVTALLRDLIGETERTSPNFDITAVVQQYRE